jgi:hypothetical protein
MTIGFSRFFISITDHKQTTNIVKRFQQIMADGEYLELFQLTHTHTHTWILCLKNKKTRPLLWQEMYGETILPVSLNKMIAESW